MLESGFTEDSKSADKIGLARFMFNTYTYEHHPMCFEISNTSIRRLLDLQFGDHTITDYIRLGVGSGKVWFIFGSQTFEMDYEVREGNICFVKGWGSFIKKNSLQEGDVLVLQPINNSQIFRNCTMQREDFNGSYDERANECEGI